MSENMIDNEWASCEAFAHMDEKQRTLAYAAFVHGATSVVELIAEIGDDDEDAIDKLVEDVFDCAARLQKTVLETAGHA